MELLKKCPVCKSEFFSSYIELKDYFLSQEKFEIVKCKECGFRFTNPRPNEDKLSSYYESDEYISHSNEKNGCVEMITSHNKQIHPTRNHVLFRIRHSHLCAGVAWYAKNIEPKSPDTLG